MLLKIPWFNVFGLMYIMARDRLLSKLITCNIIGGNIRVVLNEMLEFDDDYHMSLEDIRSCCSRE